MPQGCRLEGWRSSFCVGIWESRKVCLTTRTCTFSCLCLRFSSLGIKKFWVLTAFHLLAGDILDIHSNQGVSAAGTGTHCDHDKPPKYCTQLLQANQWCWPVSPYHSHSLAGAQAGTLLEDFREGLGVSAVHAKAWKLYHVRLHEGECDSLNIHISLALRLMLECTLRGEQRFAEVYMCVQVRTAKLRTVQSIWNLVNSTKCDLQDCKIAGALSIAMSRISLLYADQSVAKSTDPYACSATPTLGILQANGIAMFLQFWAQHSATLRELTLYRVDLSGGPIITLGQQTNLKALGLSQCKVSRYKPLISMEVCSRLNTMVYYTRASYLVTWASDHQIVGNEPSLQSCASLLKLGRSFLHSKSKNVTLWWFADEQNCHDGISAKALKASAPQHLGCNWAYKQGSHWHFHLLAWVAAYQGKHLLILSFKLTHQHMSSCEGHLFVQQSHCIQLHQVARTKHAATFRDT